MRGVVRERAGSRRGGCARERGLKVAQGELDREFGRERERKQEA